MNATTATKTIDQGWRAKIDWVAAGQKAFATRQRNVRKAARAKKAKAAK